MNPPAAPSTPATATAHDPALLHGDGRYGFAARVEGDDLVVTDVRATWFGGAHDPCDNGQTASGLSTRLHPDLLGCALPMNGYRLTRGSPLPDLPYMTTAVRVTCPATGKSASVPLIDLGPSAPPHAHAAIDLTLAAFRALGGNPAQGSLTVDFRIPGGARRLPPDQLLAARSARPADPIKRAATAPTAPAVVPAAAHPRAADDLGRRALRRDGGRPRRPCRPAHEGKTNAECRMQNAEVRKFLSAAPLTFHRLLPLRVFFRL